jgi:hypothetical protein
MKRMIHLVCLLTFVFLAGQPLRVAGDPVPTDEPGGPTDPGPGGTGSPTCYCAVHCGNNSYWGGTVTPQECVDKYNGVCGTSGGNISCGDYIHFTEISHGAVLVGHT